MSRRNRVIPPIETVMKHFRGCTDVERPDCAVIRFTRSDNQVTASVCNGYVLGVATYEDRGKKEEALLPPEAYEVIHYCDITDFTDLVVNTAKFMPVHKNLASLKDWSKYRLDMLKSAEPAEEGYFDANLFKSILPKVKGRTPATVKFYKTFTTIDYEIRGVKFNWICLNCRKVEQD